MSDSQAVVKQPLPTWLKAIIISLLLIGIFFRFAHLGKKVYWMDEGFTSLAISGHTLTDIQEDIFTRDNVLPITELSKYQHINQDTGIIDTVNYLVNSDPQHPPLYYILARMWAEAAGDTPARLRALSAVISLFVFPCTYWLCVELFSSATVAWISLGLVALSPLEILFAQEARQYGLWMVTILLSSAALLRAIRKNNALAWSLYAVTSTLGLYTHLFHILVIAGHGIYVLLIQRTHWYKAGWCKPIRNYSLSVIAILLCFMPWTIVFIKHIDTALQFNALWSENIVNTPTSYLSLFLLRTSRIFFDINLASDSWFIEGVGLDALTLSNLLLIGLIAIIISYTLYFWLFKNFAPSGLFILSTGIFPWLCLCLSDICFGGSLSLHSRYHLPLYLFLQISTAYIIAYQFSHQDFQNIRRKAGLSIVLISLVIAAGISDISFFRAESWWVSIRGSSFIKMAQTMNQATAPLLVSESDNISLGATLAVSRRLDLDAALLPVSPSTLSLFPTDYENVFFVDRESFILDQLKQDTAYQLELIDPDIGFWKVRTQTSLLTKPNNNADLTIDSDQRNLKKI